MTTNVAMQKNPSRRIASATMGTRERAMRSRLLKRVIGLMLLATVLSIVHVWSRVQVLNVRYAITDVQQRVERLSKTVAHVESLVESLQSAERLTRVAREELGLSTPTAGQVVIVRTPEQEATRQAAVLERP